MLRRYADSHSEEAFSELVHRRIGLVYSVALRRTRDAHRAEDVVQAVFIDLARKAASLSRHAVLVGWLYRSAHFAATDVVRAEISRSRRETEAHTMQETLRDDGLAPEWEKVRPVLDQAMSELNDDDRDAILLRFFDGRQLADIGVRFQLSENAARMRVERALDKLHGLLARRGITSTTTALGAILAQQVTATTPTGLAATVISTAVASVSVGAPSSLTAYNFMTTTKMATGIAGIALLILAAGTATYLHNHPAAKTQGSIAPTNSTFADLLPAPKVADSKAIMPSSLLVARPAEASKISPRLQEYLDNNRNKTGKQFWVLGLYGRKLNSSFGEVFGLTPEEVASLEAQVSATCAALDALIRENSKVKISPSGTTVITTVPFDGEPLDREFRETFKRTLGPERFDAFQILAGDQLYRAMARFGAENTRIEIEKTTAEDGSPRIQVTDHRVQVGSNTGYGSDSRMRPDNFRAKYDAYLAMLPSDK